MNPNLMKQGQGQVLSMIFKLAWSRSDLPRAKTYSR